MASDSAQRMRWEQVIGDAAVARLLEPGATQVDIGQGDESWVVLWSS